MSELSLLLRGRKNPLNDHGNRRFVGWRCSHPRLFVLTLLLVFAFLFSPTGQGAEGLIMFEIPSAKAPVGLNLFAQQADVQIFYPFDQMENVDTNAVSGELTLEEGLEELLAGTCLHLTTRKSDIVTLDINDNKRGFWFLSRIESNCNKQSMLSAISGNIMSSLAAPFRQDEEGVFHENRESQQETRDKIEEVVVTGTLIRGVSPAGANTIDLSRAIIRASGAKNTNQLLADLPQVTNYFNDTPAISRANDRVSISRPVLRNIPGGNTSGGALTLVLVDGHRVVGAGIQQVAVDPDIIPPDVIERVEVMANGGSALYGSDVVGGVINLITKKRVDGVEANASFGLADSYETYNGSFIAGKEWENGSIYGSYAYSTKDAIFSQDREYVKRIDWETSEQVGRECDPGNVRLTTFDHSNYSFSTTSFALPELRLETFNSCSLTDDSTIYPSEQRHHFMAAFNRAFSDDVMVDLGAFYSERSTFGNNGALRETVRVGPENPYYQSLPFQDPAAVHSVAFSYGPVFGNRAAVRKTEMQSWNLTPSVSIDLDRGWNFSGMLNYGESTTSFANPAIFTALQTQAVADLDPQTALNPYSITATSSELLDNLFVTDRGEGNHRFENIRGIFDGTLLELPGGEVRVALGAEYYTTTFDQMLTDRTSFTPGPRLSYTQSVQSIFAEMLIPLAGESNALPGVHGLQVSVSGRYDKYNDFAETFNPRLGVTYSPTDWLAIVASWGTSFSAPSPTDQLGVETSSLLVLPRAVVPNGTTPPPVPASAYSSLVLRGGAVNNLKPQTAKDWSIGFRLTPSKVSDMALQASFYQIEYEDALNSPFQTPDPQIFFAQFPELYTVYPTDEEIIDLVSQVNGGIEAAEPFLHAGGQPVASIYDIRVRNLGKTELSGIDFSASYVKPTYFGAYEASVVGNYQLKGESQASPQSPVEDILEYGGSRLQFSGSIGMTSDDLKLQLSLKHSSGFDIVRSDSVLQDKVDDFTTIDLYLQYALKSLDASLSLNVTNALDEDPPELRDKDTNGYTNGSAIGRLIQIGINKQF